MHTNQELQGISYNITREIAPIYTCGDADPRSFSRGKLLPLNSDKRGNSRLDNPVPRFSRNKNKVERLGKVA